MRDRAKLINELIDVLTSAGYAHGVAVSVLRTLTGYLGGQQVYWPKEIDNRKEFLRDKNIAQDKEAGLTVGEIARKYGLSEQSVYNRLFRNTPQQKVVSFVEVDKKIPKKKQ